MIFRSDYINLVTPFINSPVVKILAGVRRSGKSTILEMLSTYIGEQYHTQNIIKRKYTQVLFGEDFSIRQMYNDLVEEIQKKDKSKKCYLFLDELQEVDGWEKVINDLLESFDVDIYVTGSNSKLLSSEISTYLTGRYVLIPVFTLSFAEYLTFKNQTSDNAKTVFNEYLQYGGFPLIATSNFDTHSAYQIIEGVYASVVSRDISLRHQIRNVELFERVVRFIIENIGKTFSANSIVKFLKNENRTLSVESIYNYINWLCEAFIIYPCQRFDLQGKSILKTQEKYYLSDIGFKYCKLGFDPKMISSILENIVFLEIKRRGYEVYIGKNETKEIDFIGIRRENKIYIQVCQNLPTQSDREIENLLEIKDHYHKYVVCRDDLALGNHNGVEIIHIADFLLKKEW